MSFFPAKMEASPVVVKDARLLKLVSEDAEVEKVAKGFRFTEGPVWHPEGACLIFSDIPANRLYLFDPAGRKEPPHVFQGEKDPPPSPFLDVPNVYILRANSEGANGNTLYDSQLFTCEHLSRSVTRTDPKGAKVTLEMKGQTRLFNSPNDIVVKRDGSVWFTDPTYGLEKRQKEQETNNVFCVDVGTRQLHAVATDCDQPNGLCFSPDETLLYVADSGKPHHIRVFHVEADNSLSGGKVFAVIERGVPDGMRCDAEGNLWSTAGDGVYVFDPKGTFLGKILVPETPANLCFGGKDGDELYLTAQTSLYRVKLKAHKTED